jgi:hypothetical protein
MATAGLVASERIDGAGVFQRTLPVVSFPSYLGPPLKWIAVWTVRLVVAFGLGVGPPLVVLTSGGYLSHLNH